MNAPTSDSSDTATATNGSDFEIWRRATCRVVRLSSEDTVNSPSTMAIVRMRRVSPAGRRGR